MDVEHLKSWIGRKEVVEDHLPTFPARALAATLDRQGTFDVGDHLPPLWHWIYFLSIPRQSEIDEDGNAKRGGFIPPVPLPRRMFAGAQIVFHRPVRLGQPARRESTIENIEFKTGRTGTLAFLKIRNEVRDAAGIAMTEYQDLVYREPAATSQSANAKLEERRAEWTETVTPSDALLFRYSALIFNAHRIHLDREYAMERQGYGGLVVHGQLVATMLVELAQKNAPDRVAAFRFKAVRPILDTAPFTLCGKRVGQSAMLWALDGAGEVAMEAEASFAQR